MFGLIREKVLKIADGIWKGWVGFWSGDENAVHKKEITSVADYLEEMGYDLVNYGFLDTDGKQVTIESGENGEETIKNSKNKIILKREIEDDTGELKIKKLRSECIETYLTAENLTYIVANQNKSVSSIWNNLWDDSDDKDHKKANWGTGMIYIEGMSEDTANSLGASSDSEWGKSKNVKIDRENKKLVVTKDKHVYQYSLDGWSGRYGKSLEFLLTLHLATMAPDFVCDVATIEEFDTKVHVALYEVDTSIEIVYKLNDGEYAILNESNYSSFGLTGDQWQAIKEYNNDNLTTYTPLITKVTNHWFKNLDFANCYAEVENDPNTTDDDEKFTYYYPYVGLGEDDDVLANNENIYVREVRKKDIYQISEPKVIDNSVQIKKMLLGSTNEENSENTNKDYQYYIYTGSAMPKDQDEREKDYIIKKVQLEDKEMGYTMNTRTFTYAFAILESVHSEDAEYVLRDLKELFREIGIKADELNPDHGSQDAPGEIQPLIWPIKGYRPIVWDPVYDAETSKVNIKHKSESTLGFDKGIDFIMPADGQIVQITRGEKDEKGNTTGDTIKIRFTGTSNRKDLEDMYIYVSGIKVDDRISEGATYSHEQKIGETIEKDIIIIMTDSKRKAVQNVDQYLQPDKWDFETADEITESNFGNDIFGNGGGTSNSSGTVTTVGTSSIARNNTPITSEYASGYKKTLSASEIQTVLNRISQYHEIILRKSQQYGVPAEWIMAIIAEESAGMANVGDGIMIGLMQINSTFSNYTASQLYNPENNIDQGTRWVAEQLNNTGGQIYEALGRYGVGPTNWNESKARNGYSSSSILGRDDALRVCDNLNTPGNNGYMRKMDNWCEIMKKYYDFTT